MFIRLWLAILLLIIVLSACGTAAPTAQGSETPTTISTPTPVDSDAAQPSTPPTIIGEITQIDQRILVEQQPGATIGNKIVFSLNDATRIFVRTGNELQPKTAGDLAVGQRVEVWAVDGIVAESFPGQATAETITIADTVAEMTTTPNAATLPDREPDVVGTITQASNTVWVDQSFILFMTPTTLFFRSSGQSLEPIDARDITERLQIEAWVDEISYEGSPPRGNAIAIVVIDD